MLCWDPVGTDTARRSRCAMRAGWLREDAFVVLGLSIYAYIESCTHNVCAYVICMRVCARRMIMDICSLDVYVFLCFYSALVVHYPAPQKPSHGTCVFAGGRALELCVQSPKGLQGH